ncbi:MAG: T9SS type A sorting domain-containing protein [Chitinophagaceae bacterium]|nr:T9SS type A sorting domain-containing protein [Chitinophagaceae bacterium]
MKKIILFTNMLFALVSVYSQKCTPAGDQTTYGTGNVWIGYAYKNKNLNNYRGYVNEGTAASPNFDQNFGGENVDYPTHGCPVNTNKFSIRYKLSKYFASGTYLFTIGGDDGFRLSLDGGATWAINAWVDQSYTVKTLTIALSGTYNMILEYYDQGGANRISFSVVALCNGSEDANTYGTGNTWNGYVYDGINFNIYSGMVHEGSSTSPDFDENFGGDNVSYATSGCSVQTETFSVRYRLTKTFAPGTYMFTVGGDDGYRLSIDGGNTWIINNWGLHSYTTSNSSASLNGSYDMVLEYYENSGANRVSFSMRTLSILPVILESFTAVERESTVQLKWDISSNSDLHRFEVEKSTDGQSFSAIGNVSPNNNSVTQYSFTDQAPIREITYYRLKITGKNGISTYSRPVTIRPTSNSGNNLNVYPTVVRGNSFFLTSSNSIRNAVVTVTALNGKVIARQNAGNIIAGQPVSVSTNAANYGKGIYLVTLSGSDFERSTGKIIIP